MVCCVERIVYRDLKKTATASVAIFNYVGLGLGDIALIRTVFYGLNRDRKASHTSFGAVDEMSCEVFS